MKNKKPKKGFRFVKSTFGRFEEIPKNWIEGNLDSLQVKTSSGGTPLRDFPSYYKGNILWVKSGELKDNLIYDSEEKITQDGLVNSSAKFFPVDTVLVAMYGATIGYTGILKNKGTTNQAICAIPPNKIFDPFFLQQCLIAKRSALVSVGMGAGQPNISQEIIRKIKFNIPSLLEQKKIANILFNVDLGIQQIQHMIKQTQKLKNGLEEKLFSKGIGHSKLKRVQLGLKFKETDIPKMWETKKIKELFNVVRGGSPRPAGDPKYFGGKIPWITVQEITKDNNMYLFSTKNGLTEEGKRRSRMIKKETLLLANSGATLGVPKISMIDGCINDGVAAFLKPSTKIFVPFLYYLLNSWTLKLRSINQGMGQPNLNTIIIGNLLIPLPDILEQQKIAAIFSNVDLEIKSKQDNVSHLTILKKGLMQKLLTGQIRV